jgi:hypothetical protein
MGKEGEKEGGRKKKASKLPIREVWDLGSPSVHSGRKKRPMKN